MIYARVVNRVVRTWQSEGARLENLEAWAQSKRPKTSFAEYISCC